MQTVPKSITFAVDDVKPAQDRLAECRACDGLVTLTGRQAIACSDYTTPVVKDVAYNPLVYAVHRAYADHRPLVLSPDGVWLTISQGIKHHILLHSAELREAFVPHAGKKVIEVEVEEDFVPDSPYADWESILGVFGERLLEQIHEDKRGLLIERFSTTGSREYTAYIVNMMDAFQRYFDYVLKYICGIPQITLEGATADWRRILEKIRPLDEIGLSWWRECLDPVLAQFVRASEGDVDLHHWRSVYKVVESYGKDRLTGWITTLFPYLWNKYTGEIYRNRYLGIEPEPPQTAERHTPGMKRQTPGRKTEDPGVKLDEFPLGLSSAPVHIRTKDGGSVRRLEVSAGFTGVQQVGESGALRPMIGWAVHGRTKLKRLLDEIESRHAVSAGGGTVEDHAAEFPAELSELYDRFKEAVLFERRLSRCTRIRPRSPSNWFRFTRRGYLNVILNDCGVCATVAERLESSRYAVPRRLGELLNSLFNPLDLCPLRLYGFVDLPDGTHVGFVFTETGGWHYVRFRRGLSGPRLPVIATSAEELLESFLASAEPRFSIHGYYEFVREKHGWECVYRTNE